jgi:hypothetical protein
MANWTALLMLPGIIPGMIFGARYGGGIHDISFPADRVEKAICRGMLGTSTGLSQAILAHPIALYEDHRSLDQGSAFEKRYYNTQKTQQKRRFGVSEEEIGKYKEPIWNVITGRLLRGVSFTPLEGPRTVVRSFALKRRLP